MNRSPRGVPHRLADVTSYDLIDLLDAAESFPRRTARTLLYSFRGRSLSVFHPFCPIGLRAIIHALVNMECGVRSWGARSEKQRVFQALHRMGLFSRESNFLDFFGFEGVVVIVGMLGVIFMTR